SRPRAAPPSARGGERRRRLKGRGGGRKSARVGRTERERGGVRSELLVRRVLRVALAPAFLRLLAQGLLDHFLLDDRRRRDGLPDHLLGDRLGGPRAGGLPAGGLRHRGRAPLGGRRSSLRYVPHLWQTVA